MKLQVSDVFFNFLNQANSCVPEVSFMWVCSVSVSMCVCVCVLGYK